MVTWHFLLNTTEHLRYPKLQKKNKKLYKQSKAINKQCVLLSGATGFGSVTYPSSLPLVPSSTSTLCWSGKLQFTLDSLVLPVWRVESYTLTLPTYSPTRWCWRREGMREYILFNQANLALQCESAIINRACKICCAMHVSVWRLRHTVCRLGMVDSTNGTDV